MASPGFYNIVETAITEADHDLARCVFRVEAHDLAPAIADNIATAPIPEELGMYWCCNASGQQGPSNRDQHSTKRITITGHRRFRPCTTRTYPNSVLGTRSGMRSSKIHTASRECGGSVAIGDALSLGATCLPAHNSVILSCSNIAARHICSTRH